MASPADELPPGSKDFILHIIPRSEWNAKSIPRKLMHLPKLPYKLVLDHFTYTPPCNEPYECFKAVQDMQAEHMSKGYNDIKYNFLIGGDGYIYEGRGWHICSSRSLRNLIRMWKRRLDIAFIGDFSGKPIPEVMMKRFHEVVDFGVKEDLIKRFPVALHCRQGVWIRPVEGTLDDFVGNALSNLEGDNVIKRHTRERLQAIKKREEEEAIEEGWAKAPIPADKEEPITDCACDQTYKSQQDKLEKKVINGIEYVVWKTEEIYRT